MKKFINDPYDTVDEMVEGFAQAQLETLDAKLMIIGGNVDDIQSVRISASTEFIS